MDFRFAPEDEALRREVREFVRREWDPHGLDSSSNGVFSYDIHVPEDMERVRDFARKLVAQGWYTMHWPKEHGGGEAPLRTQLAYREEMAYQGAPLALGGSFVAPMLMIYGAPWQKEFFLPKIARAEIMELSQGFSEPNAGADLGNLQTRAVRDGDDWVVSGQKIWNTGGHVSEWGHYLVRTDPNAPKHRGISYFFVDMKSPGITLRPLYDALGRRRWSEVFLDGVRVPARNLIGELNRGWYAAMAALSFERSHIEAPARRLRDLEQFTDFARAAFIGGTPLIVDPLVRHTLAEQRIRIEVGRMICYQVAWLQSQGKVPEEAAYVKLYCDQMESGVHDALAGLLREYSVLSVGDRRAPLGGYPGVYAYLSWMMRFAAGGYEIQRNIVAQRFLKLPR
ncbi:MAG: acyl-CoA dehydrogenase family protein [Chloroflexi bacterium]|nr:acyl-CoA dehydrogenase family protein [Chloroflexota bacterium]